MTDHEDRDTAMMITCPMIDLFRGPPTRHHRAGREDLVVQRPGRTGRSGVAIPGEAPSVQSLDGPAVAAGIARGVIRSGDKAIQGHGHEQHRCAHLDLPVDT
jgi:hypothetical protein